MNQKFPPGEDSIHTFTLDQSGDFLVGQHVVIGSQARINAYGIVSDGIRGRKTSGFSVIYRLRSGCFVSQGAQTPLSNHFNFGHSNILHSRSVGLGYWQSRDEGFVGFKFNNGAGVQYGSVPV